MVHCFDAIFSADPVHIDVNWIRHAVWNQSERAVILGEPWRPKNLPRNVARQRGQVRIHFTPEEITRVLFQPWLVDPSVAKAPSG
jgi:hypothetical protein